MRRVFRGLAYLYGIMGILTILMIPASLYRWFGIERDPLSAVFALLLGLPWTLLLNLLETPSTYLSLTVAALGITTNFLLLMALSKVS